MHIIFSLWKWDSSFVYIGFQMLKHFSTMLFLFSSILKLLSGALAPKRTRYRYKRLERLDRRILIHTPSILV